MSLNVERRIRNLEKSRGANNEHGVFLIVQDDYERPYCDEDLVRVLGSNILTPVWEMEASDVFGL